MPTQGLKSLEEEVRGIHASLSDAVSEKEVLKQRLDTERGERSHLISRVKELEEKEDDGREVILTLEMSVTLPLNLILT